MNYGEAAGLGLMQALTEFLPVSSSGHLRLLRDLLGVEVESGLLFDLVLHLGTLVAVFIVYHARIWGLLSSIGAGLKGLGGGIRAAFEASEALRYGLLLLIAMIPTAVFGFMIKGFVESDAYSTKIVGAFLIVNGFLLYSLKWVPKGEDRGSTHWLAVDGIGPLQALLIGTVQGLAVVPGISRSGSTIVSALFLGAARPRAAEFSFFLSIPTILGALVLESGQAMGEIQNIVWGPFIVGAVVALVFGVVALRLLLKMLEKAELHYFAAYSWIVGVAAVIFS